MNPKAVIVFRRNTVGGGIRNAPMCAHLNSEYLNSSTVDKSAAGVFWSDWTSTRSYYEMGVPKTTICSMLTEDFGIKMVSVLWVPKLLSASHKQDRVDFCNANFSLLNKDLNLLNILLAGYGTWDTKGLLLIKFIAGNTTINGAVCAGAPMVLRPAVEKKRGRAAEDENLFTCTNHTPCSPDLTLSDYYSYRNLKKDIRDKRYSDDNEIKS
ncbi:hypothetical protein Fcan01_19049 [Folsomia candida]|uniref:Uncharacterized protein n=1 Tax=Folsomia candida TaxID=158441 RepID=A0A226DL52_FOLCA|nr:hypothetical protein Fcan01_19049 [Folsomia candida]